MTDNQMTKPAVPAQESASEPDIFAGVGGAPAQSEEPDLFAGFVAPAPAQQPQAAPAEEPDIFASFGAAQSPASAAAAPGGPALTPLQQNQQDVDSEPDASDIAAAPFLGAAKGVFAAKDFFATGGGLWGTPPAEDQRSGLRQSIDAASADRSQRDGAAYDLSEGLAQGAVGLLGVGKIAVGGMAVKAAAGAVATAASFEPHAGNFANLVAKVPGLDGPVTQFFASSPDDSAFAGYLKNALVSLGFEAGAIGLFTGSAAMLKALRDGEPASIQAARGELRQALQARSEGEPLGGSSSSSSSPAEPAVLSPTPGSTGEPSAAASTDQSSAAAAAAAAADSSLRGRIQDAYLKASGGDLNKRVWLSDIRGQMPDVPRDDLDAELAKLHLEPGNGAQLSGTDNPTGDFRLSQDGPARQAAAMDFKGEPQDALYLTKRLPEAAPSAAAPSVTPEPSANGRATSSPTQGAAETGAPAITHGNSEVGLAEESAASSAIPVAEGAASSPYRPFNLDQETFAKMVASADKDGDALTKYGSWDAAIANGHTFGDDLKIPWQKFATTNSAQAETSLDAFMTRMRDAYGDQLDAAKGGAVQTDPMADKAVAERVNLWNQDPSTLVGMLQAAGERAGSLRADMQSGFALSFRAMQDSWTMAARIKAGELSDWGGSRDVALAALKEQTGVAASLYASANSIMANSARAVRGMRSEFRLDPIMLRNIASVDGEQLAQILASTKGDPRALAEALKPGRLQMLMDGAQFFMVNNLISSPLTHAIIAASNAWQALARPAMRMAGSAINGSWETVGREAQATYGYMASAIPDAFNSAVDAFKAGDSIISPHSAGAAMDLASGGSPVSGGLGQTIAQMQFGPWNNVGDIARNALIAGLKTGAFPSRVVGFQDELVKQIVYRGKVQAQALIGGSAQGLAGDELASYVKAKLYDAFDGFGRATDGAALQEARVASYQNDLNATGSFGWSTMGASFQKTLENNPPLRIIVPFLRTPVNLFRQGVQLTPGLNMAQKEFRDAILDASRPEAQAQAIGQMAMGSLLMGTIGTLAYQGYVTGDAPSDPVLASDAMADGWRPHSIVIPHADGSKTYVPFDRYDPLMMPMAMAANIVSIIQADPMANQTKAESMLSAMSLGLLKQLTDKLYLHSMQSTLEAIQAPDRKAGRVLGTLAGNFVPYSSALHLFNTDPIMHEADSFTSAMLSKVPGFSSDFPARYDWAGDPITVHKGLWLDTPASQADAEVQRLALTQGGSVGAPSAMARGGADLRSITMQGDKDSGAAGMSAYARFQELAGHPEKMPGGEGRTNLRDKVGQLIASPQYQQSPDGSPSTPGTRTWMLMQTIDAYRKGAMASVSADQNVRAAEMAETYRVQAARGHTDAAPPTQTNQLNGMLGSLGKMMGLSSLGSGAK